MSGGYEQNLYEVQKQLLRLAEAASSEENEDDLVGEQYKNLNRKHRSLNEAQISKCKQTPELDKTVNNDNRGSSDIKARASQSSQT